MSDSVDRESLQHAHDRINVLETRLAATVKRLGERVAKLEAATPAKVRVVAPEADGMHTPVWRDGWRQADRAWRAALAAAGVEVKEASK
jgi:hypothetical protein